MEQLKTLESSESALVALRRHISRPTAMFNKYEALDLLQSLVRLARNESHKKANEYAAALDEIRARTDALDHLQLQRLFLGLLGDPVHAKVAREATTILKGVGKAPTPLTGYGSIARRPSPYPPQQNTQCFRCFRWGHVARSCRYNPVRRQGGRIDLAFETVCVVFQINCSLQLFRFSFFHICFLR